MSFLSNLLNPFSSRNPLRPDNLIKDPFGITASDLLTDAKKTDTATVTPAINADGSFASPTTGYQRAYNAFLREGAPGASGAAAGTSAWNQAFNAWLGPILEANGAYAAYDAGKIADPVEGFSDDWDFSAGGTEVPVEQDLLQRALDDYIYPALDKDRANQVQFADILAGYQPAINGGRDLINGILIEDGTTGRSVQATRELANLDEAMGKMYGANAALRDGNLENIWGAYQERLRAGETLKDDMLESLWGAYQERLRGNADLEADKRENLWGAYQERLRAHNPASVQPPSG